MGMTPVVELRGAIPLGVSLGFPLYKSILISLLGNITIVPFLLKFFLPVANYLEGTEIFKNTIGWLKRRTIRRTKEKIRSYRLLGLFLLVAIPLPTTGAWTGAMAAALLKLDFKKSLISISLGLITSSLVVMTLLKNLV